MTTDRLLGDIELSKKEFSASSEVFQELALIKSERAEKVNRALLQLIQKEPEPCFLLSAVLEFIDRVNREELLSHYNFHDFEFWLNQYSGLSFEDNYRIRAKIAGKLVDRSDYQVLFPIGGGKIYEGTHFVTAHKSPDLDTTIASFWGWLDAFAARVGDGLHIWNVPGGPPPQIEIDWIFRDLFGSSIFSCLAETRSSLSLSSDDLVTQKGMIRKHLSDSIASVDHDRDQNAVVVTDSKGCYVGDWRSSDVEGVREVILLLSSCLRWFENALHLHLMELFKKPSLHGRDVAPFLDRLFQLKLADCEPGREFSLKQRQKVSDFIAAILDIENGLECTFERLGKRLREFVGADQSPFESAEALWGSMNGLFDGKGNLLEERSQIFGYLEAIIRSLHEAIFKIRGRLETLDVALKTKQEVLKHNPTYIAMRGELDEIRRKIGLHPYLTVNQLVEDRLYPVGVIHAAALKKNILGTVSLRDFCNRDEMGIPSYLEIISVIDHHKSNLSTTVPFLAVIADAQSCNTLVGKQSFLVNDRHSLLGQTEQGIEQQLSQMMSEVSPQATRMMQNLLQRRMIAKNGTKFFVHPDREYIEYLHFLYAIIDDTDLLSKVTPLDVECVAELLNRMKSLVSGRISEIISLDDLPRNRGFAKKAAQRILQNEDMYSLYRRVYALREKEIEKNLKLASEGKPSNLFIDTKEQNGCCRIGQTKLFASNIGSFEKQASKIRQTWLQTAQSVYREIPEIALHLHMISTITSAEEVYRGVPSKYSHRDELWIWVPPGEVGSDLLKRFLGAFKGSAGLKNNPMEVEFLGDRSDELSTIFKESFSAVHQKVSNERGSCKTPPPRKIDDFDVDCKDRLAGPVRSDENMSIAVLRFNPGALNSRKAMVSPYLPT